MSFQARTILAIDDSAAILTFLRISLELHGATFYSASTASDGVRLCHELQPDLVILDLGLPDRSGVDILPELIQDSAAERPAPAVIVLTVRKEQAMRQKTLELGASAYITKPFLMDELLEVMAEYLTDAPEAAVPAER